MKTDTAWQRWGESEPYYAVLTDERYLSGNLDDVAREQFFASGAAYVDSLMSAISRKFPNFQPDTIADFGCGTGRVLLPLASRCSHAYGVDVSEAMLKEAQDNAQLQNVANVSFFTTDELIASSRRVSFMHSSLVFQHIRPEQGRSILVSLLGKLENDGVAAIQFCTATGQSGLRRRLNWLKNSIPGANAMTGWLRGKRTMPAPMEMHAYDSDDVHRVFKRSGFDVVLQWQSKHQGIVITTFVAAASNAGGVVQ